MAAFLLDENDDNICEIADFEFSLQAGSSTRTFSGTIGALDLTRVRLLLSAGKELRVKVDDKVYRQGRIDSPAGRMTTTQGSTRVVRIEGRFG